MKKILLMIPLFSALLSSSVYSSEPSSPDSNQEETKEIVSLNKGNFISSVKIVGDIEAKKQIYMAPPFSAKVEALAEDGEKIKKGQLVAKLESKELEDELSEIELESGQAKSELSAIEKDSAAELVKLNANILLAEKNMQLKKMELKRLIEMPTKEELKKLELNVNLAQKALSISKAELAQKNTLYNQGILKSKDILEQKLTIARKEKDYATARAEYILTKNGATDTSIAIAKLEIEKAENTLVLEKNNLKFRQELINLEKSKVKVKVDVNQKKVEEIKSYISEATLKAPADGTVVISRIWGSAGLEKVKIGDTAYRGEPFISIANLDDIIIKTQVEEQFIGRIKTGLPCLITTVGLKGKVFKGKITKIGLLATEKRGGGRTEGESKVFDLDIELEKTDNVFKPGMSVDIEIVLKSMANVVLVPNKAVYKDGNKNFVYLADGSKRYIKLGLSNPEQSIAETGINAGEKVAIEKNIQEGA